MNPALWAAKTGLDAQQTRMAVTSNNLANVGTTGFKKGRAVFEDLLYQNVRQVGASTSQDTEAPTGLSLGTGVRVVATEKNFTQGNLSQTGNSLDVAINGRGFFQVLLPDGTMGYTRDGGFKVSAQGELVTASGYAVQPGITLPDGSQTVTIGKDGVVTVQLAGQSSPTQVGSLQLFDFINPVRHAAARRKHVRRICGQRHCAVGHARVERTGHGGAGLARSLQRQRRRRAGEHDRNPARL